MLFNDASTGWNHIHYLKSNRESKISVYVKILQVQISSCIQFNLNIRRLGHRGGNIILVNWQSPQKAFKGNSKMDQYIVLF